MEFAGVLFYHIFIVTVKAKLGIYLFFKSKKVLTALMKTCASVTTVVFFLYEFSRIEFTPDCHEPTVLGS